MSRLTMIWGVLLLAGIFMVDINAESSMVATVQSSKAHTTSNTTPTTPHATTNSTTTTPHATTNTTLTTPHATTNTTLTAPHATTNTTLTAPHATTNTTLTTPHATTNATHSTPHATTNATHKPSSTTSHASTNTTTHPTTAHTTSPILPTKPSPPQSSEYKVKNGNVTCIIADMGLALELDNSTTAMQNKDAKVKWYFNVNPANTTGSGTCNESKATLILTFPQGSINFVFVKEKKIYYIDEVSVNFTWNSAERWNGRAEKLKLLSTDVGYATKCKTTPTVKVASNLRLSIADVKLQAFDIQNDKFGKEEVCSYDRNVIAVAVAVTVLVVIIIAIVIFFICHKKRSSGYQRI